MSDKTYRVLFVCTGNSARSIMAEAVLNHAGGRRFVGYSAGSRPKGSIDPFALRALQHLKVPVDGARSKSWGEFTAADAPPLDFVFTVCDKAAGEVCPVWPGQPMTAQWGVPDPVAAEGTNEQRLRVFIDTAVTLKRRIDLMLALPIDTLDRLSLQREVQQIGRQ